MPPYTTVTCTHCQVAFQLRVSTYNFRVRAGQSVFFCTVQCARTYHRPARQEQMHAVFLQKRPLRGPRD